MNIFMRYILTFAMAMIYCISSFAQDITPFQDDKGRWGYKNQDGKVIYKCKFEVADQFSNGVARVGSGGKFGLLGENGKFVYPMKLSAIEYAENARFKVAEGGKYDKEGIILEGAKWGYVDNHGDEIIEVKYDKIESFVNNEARATYKGKQGYINWNGNVIVPFEYPFIGPFNEEGLTWAGIQGKQKVVYTIIDRTGSSLLPKADYNYIYAGSDSQTMIFYRDPNSKDDELKSSPELGSASEIQYLVRDEKLPASDGYFFVSNKAAKVGLVDNNGQVLIPIKSYSTVSLPVNGVSVVLDSRKRSFYAYDIARRKATLLAAPGTTCRHISEEGVVLTILGEKIFQYKDINGEAIGEHCLNAYDFKDGIGISTNKTSKYGAIDKFGNTVIEFKYDSLGMLKDNGMIYASAGKNKFGFINKQGEEVIPLMYSGLRDFINGMAIAHIGKNYGCIDENNNAVVELKWRGVFMTESSKDIIFVANPDNDKWSMYSVSKKEIITDDMFDKVHQAVGEGNFIVENDNKFAVVDQTGALVVPYVATDLENAKIIYDYMEEHKAENLQLIDIIRYSRAIKNSQTVYLLDQVIDNSNWDY